MVTKTQIQIALVQAAQNGTLKTPKHDPYQLGTSSYGFYRTVLSFDLADNLMNFLTGCNYDIHGYEDKRSRHFKDFYVIEPLDASFSVPASGVCAYSPTANSKCDRLAVVSGLTQGWHMFGEVSSHLSNLESGGELIYRSRLTDL